MQNHLIKLYLAVYVNDWIFSAIAFWGFATFNYMLLPVALFGGIGIHVTIVNFLLKRYNLKKIYPNKNYLSYKYVVYYIYILIFIIILHIIMSNFESMGMLSTITFESLMYSISVSLFGGYPLLFGIYYLGMVFTGSENRMYEYNAEIK